jgi:hypothetical protein
MVDVDAHIIKVLLSCDRFLSGLPPRTIREQLAALAAMSEVDGRRTGTVTAR